MSLARAITESLRGDWSGDQGLIPTPGHSPKDRGLSIRDNATGDDVVLHCFNDASLDWKGLKDQWRKDGLLPDRNDARQPAQTPATRYVYRDSTGAEAFRMVRGASKRFHVEHPDGRGGWAAGMNGTAPLPYRLPELLAAHPDEPVYIVEGEKDADNLAALGFVTTTNPNGALKWRDSFAEYLHGRECVILPDNDGPGRAHGLDVAARLRAANIDAVILELPGLPEKGDVSDWIAAGGTAAALGELTTLAFSGLTTPGETLDLIDPALWFGIKPPAREWLLEGMMPTRQLTYLTGAGSAGKSLLAQQLATCTAAGLPLLGISARAGVAIYVTCEDDPDELHRRQAALCASLGLSIRDLGGKLHLASLAGTINSEIATFDQLGRMSTTPAWHRLRATAMQLRPALIALDGVAHLFAGNENIRNQVAAFCGLLNSLAAESGAAVLLLGHPNKAGDAFSGSTAWENQVRSRLFLETPKDDDGAVIDADVRTLSLEKANYARNGASVAFRWHDWAFVLPGDLPADQRADIAASAQASAENAAFLRCLAKATEERRAASSSLTASNYAPRLFAKMPTAKGMKVRGFEAALQRLLHSGAIINAAKVYQRDNRAWVTGLGVAPTLAPTPAQTLHEGCTDPCEDTGKNLHQPARTHPPSTTYISGAALGVAAPDSEEITDQ